MIDFESEYHYGSDFGDSSDDNDQDDDLLLTPSESDSLAGENDNDSDFSISSFSNGSGTQRKSHRAPSPDPLWLQAKDLPPLTLPESSDDLLIPKQYCLKTTSIYEVFRRFRNLIRLSPFRLEDFCAAIVSDEQSALLTEIHMMVLKALLREEDAQATHFGPLDQKDSINISIYLMDQMTWPEVLKSYVESDSSFDRNVLNIIATKDYPYVGIENRLAVLQFLTDQFLITTVVRDDLIQEGPIHYDDHCRCCHKLGDLLCCETCPAVFHLECVDPPLKDVPTEDWQCSICKSHHTTGVQDCVSTQEKQGMLSRHDHLGYDRHGRKYWFVARRLFVEEEESGDIWYYTTVQQFENLLSCLDDNEMELSLCRELIDYKDEIVRQMTITETVTNKLKGNKKSYLELENQNILDKIKKEKEAVAAAAAAENNDGKESLEDDNKKEGNETECSERSFSDSTQADAAETINEKDNESKDIASEPPSTPITNKNVVSTRLKTGSLTPRNYSTDDLKRKSIGPTSNKDDHDGETRLTRHKNNQISNGTTLYKLGMENTFKSYVNQFTTNPIALNKPQKNEERDKKRYLSHKFSLTPASEFKWNGVLNGTHSNVISTLRQTCITLEQGMVTPFMHPNWSHLRKLWLQAVSHCKKPIDFARAVVILQTCIKSPVFANVWHEHLGHIRLYRITSLEREEKKKLEKREKREREDEEERNRLAVNFVKYSLGLKHQVWKQKGEEYRIHGQWDWVWMSYDRKQHKSNNSNVDRIKPQKVITKVRSNGMEKIIMLDPVTYEYLESDTPKKESDEIKNVEIVRAPTSFESINVSSALGAQNRLLYPKIAKKSVLDDLLKRRFQLKIAEEQKHSGLNGTEIVEPQAHVIVKKHKQTSDIEKQLQKIIGVKSHNNTSSHQDSKNTQSQIPNVDMELVNSLAKSIQSARSQFAQLNRFGKQYKCYGRDCNVTPPNAFSPNSIVSCYSPMCIQKAKVKQQLLLLLRKAHTVGNDSKDTVAAIMNIVNKKPSILEQKLTEGRQSDTSFDVNYSMSGEKIDPAQIKSNLENALNRSFIGNDELDINDHISYEKQNDEQNLKVEQNDEHKMETEEMKTDEVNSKPQENEKQIESDENNANQFNTIVEDSQIAVESSIEITAENETQNNNEHNVDEILDKNEKADESKEEMLQNSVTEAIESSQNEAFDENGRERRSSRRSVKPKSTRTTMTSIRTSSKYTDGADEIETNTHARTRNKDITFDGSRTSTLNTTNNALGESRCIYRPNRRFAAISRSVKKEDMFKIEKEYATDGSEKIYSASSTRGKIYLAKLSNDRPSTGSEQLKLAIVFPPLISFLTKKSTRSIMALQKHELHTLARNGGKLMVSGFHQLAKNNNTAEWPYPCSRPLFKTCWSFRTMNAKTLAAIALQLRILWCSLRWDDMAMKPPSSDGKHQITTETEIVSLEILKHKIIGRFSEKTQYLRRKVVIPLEVPKMVRGE